MIKIWLRCHLWANNGTADTNSSHMTPFQTIEEFASHLHVSKNTVRDWIDRRMIPVLKVRNVLRIEPEEAIRALKSYKKPDKKTEVVNA
jgi:excisionase family DNA binding protein